MPGTEKKKARDRARMQKKRAYEHERLEVIAAQAEHVLLGLRVRADIGPAAEILSTMILEYVDKGK